MICMINFFLSLFLYFYSEARTSLYVASKHTKRIKTKQKHNKLQMKHFSMNGWVGFALVQTGGHSKQKRNTNRIIWWWLDFQILFINNCIPNVGAHTLDSIPKITDLRKWIIPAFCRLLSSLVDYESFFVWIRSLVFTLLFFCMCVWCSLIVDFGASFLWVEYMQIFNKLKPRWCGGLFSNMRNWTNTQCAVFVYLLSLIYGYAKNCVSRPKRIHKTVDNMITRETNSTHALTTCLLLAHPQSRVRFGPNELLSIEFNSAHLTIHI